MMGLVCVVCDKDAFEHVWVSREEFFEAALPACNVSGFGGKPFFIHKPAPPIDPATEDYMRSISK